MLEPAMLTGLAVVAVWGHVRFPRLRPASLVRAVVHVAVSFLGFAALPMTLSFLLPLSGEYAVRMGLVLTLLIPSLTYLLLSWVWLIARILSDFSGGPSGGHPVATEH